MQGGNINSRQRIESKSVISRTELAKCKTEQDLLDVCMYHWWRLHSELSKRATFAEALGCTEQRLSQYLQRAKMDGLDWLRIEKLMGQRVHRDWLDIQWEQCRIYQNQRGVI